MMNVCSAKPKVSPAASSFEKPSSTCSAIFIPRATNTMNTSSSAETPIETELLGEGRVDEVGLHVGISCVAAGRRERALAEARCRRSRRCAIE